MGHITALSSESHCFNPNNNYKGHFDRKQSDIKDCFTHLSCILSCLAKGKVVLIFLSFKMVVMNSIIDIRVNSFSVPFHLNFRIEVSCP